MLVAVGALGAPLIAATATAGDRDELQEVASTFVRWTFFPSLAVGTALLWWAGPLTGLFGDGFAGARMPLAILVAGQLVNIGTGAVGHLTNLTGHQGTAARVFCAAAVLNVVLNLLLVPRLGATGAAIATATSLAAWNLTLHAVVVRRLDVRPSIVAAAFRLSAARGPRRLDPVDEPRG